VKTEVLELIVEGVRVSVVSAVNSAAFAPPQRAYPWAVLQQWWEPPPVYRQPRVQIASLLTDVSSAS
jgi:hypothetical protein